jgi:cytoskeletal protein CcmA (bactofilin family)
MFTKSSAQSSDIPVGSQSASADRRRSVLHDGITIRGDWESDGIVEFGGTIIGDLTADTLVLTEDGKVTGNVRARNVTISGVLDGTIAAVNVTFKPQARVTANVETQTLTIEAGASVNGRIKSNPGNR